MSKPTRRTFEFNHVTVGKIGDLMDGTVRYRQPDRSRSSRHRPGPPKAAGWIVDANGTWVAQVDPNGMLPDKEAQAFAALIIVAVNTCGSFRRAVERQPEESV